jgi:hypothetical protein
VDTLPSRRAKRINAHVVVAQQGRRLPQKQPEFGGTCQHDQFTRLQTTPVNKKHDLPSKEHLALRKTHQDEFAKGNESQ